MKRYPLSVWLFALALAIITSLPYIVGALSTPQGWQYTGAAALPGGISVDYNSHLAKMWQGQRGQWDYHLLFTHEAHPGIVGVQGFYVALGAISPFSLPLMYHIVRFVLTLGMVLALWEFGAYFFEKNEERWTFLLFSTLVSGWSWLLRFVPGATDQVSPIEFWLIDAYNLLGALFMPHFAAAIILQIAAFLSFESWIRQPARKTLVGFMLALAALSIIQPYVILLSMPVLVMLCGFYLFSAKRLTWRRALWLVIPFAVHIGLIAYQYLAISGNAVWRSFSDQNVTLSPDVLYYLLGYLPFIIPILLGARAFALDKPDDRWWMPMFWIVVVGGLLYAPILTQRRYLLGVQTPLALLAAYGWTHAVTVRLAARWRPLVTSIYVTFAAVGLVLMLFGNISALATPTAPNSPFYTPDELAAYAWLERETSPNDLVLTTFNENGVGSGGRLVAATGHRVFIGHWIETTNFEAKVNEASAFYNPTVTTDFWRQAFLTRIGAAYVWYDDYSRALGPWDPATAPYLEEVFTSGSVTIYRVVLDG